MGLEATKYTSTGAIQEETTSRPDAVADISNELSALEYIKT